jgi:hypothetical protein
MQAQLSTSERHQLLSVLRDLDPAGVAENRQKPRRKVALSLWLRRIVKGGKFPVIKATLINTSPAGAGLLCPQPVAIGERFVIPLRFAEGGGWLVLCEARNCRSISDTHYKVGARFIDRIDDPSGTSRVPGDWLS